MNGNPNMSKAKSKSGSEGRGGRNKGTLISKTPSATAWRETTRSRGRNQQRTGRKTGEKGFGRQLLVLKKKKTQGRHEDRELKPCPRKRERYSLVAPARQNGPSPRPQIVPSKARKEIRRASTRQGGRGNTEEKKQSIRSLESA